MTELGTLTLRVHGELELSTADALVDALSEWLGIQRCVIDLSDCDFVDSTGMRALLECHRQVGPSAEFRMVGARPHVARALQLAGLDEHLGLDAPLPHPVAPDAAAQHPY